MEQIASKSTGTMVKAPPRLNNLPDDVASAIVGHIKAWPEEAYSFDDRARARR